ncbi:MAG: sulfite exporter TauE/SafE family protein [Planctomycetota bacterium]|nr:sulfite exporter TauE/SafE family protein [Planctomycetota bacterium]
MEIILGLCALAVAALTLYSGFGLGTLLLPVLALFYPPHIAVAATAVVHFLNNLLKLVLMRKHVDRSVLLRFALPAIPAAFLGAWLLSTMARAAPLATYELGGKTFALSTLGLTVGLLVVLFAVLELTGAMKRVAFPPRLLPLGGALSGFFGGLSGHQGALRSVVLLKSGLSKEGYVATGTAASTLVDATRIVVYGTAWIGSWDEFAQEVSLNPLLIAVACAFVGTFLGVRLLGKMTLSGLHMLVGLLLLVAGLAIALGLSA